MQRYTYLLINFLAIVICFIFSFDRKIQFNKHFIAFLKASLLVAVPFIFWDVWFTNKGVWWFNTDYTIGKNILGLPIEEWLFFICIPFSCVFTFYCLNKFFNLSWADRYNNFISWLIIVLSLTVAVLFRDRMYPLLTSLVTASTMVYLYFIARVNWIGKASFVYLILMLGFFPVNGILTGTGLKSPIVNYNSNEILNIRMLTIPIEDVFYGYAQFMLNLYFFKFFQKNRGQDKLSASPFIG